jgi:hypothetical protein
MLQARRNTHPRPGEQTTTKNPGQSRVFLTPLASFLLLVRILLVIDVRSPFDACPSPKVVAALLLKA